VIFQDLPGHTPVDNIDLVHPGQEFVVLVGRRGWESTRCACRGAGGDTDGLIRIGSGSATTCRRRIGTSRWSSRTTPVPAHDGVQEHAFGLKLRKMPKPQIHQRVMEAAKFLDIEHLLERKPRRCPAGSGSASRWAGRSSASRRVCLTSPLQPRCEIAPSPLARNSAAASSAQDDDHLRDPRQERRLPSATDRGHEGWRHSAADTPLKTKLSGKPILVGGFYRNPADELLRR